MALGLRRICPHNFGIIGSFWNHTSFQNNWTKTGNYYTSKVCKASHLTTTLQYHQRPSFQKYILFTSTRYRPAGICQHNFGIIGSFWNQTSFQNNWTKTGNYYTSKVCKAAHLTTTLQYHQRPSFQKHILFTSTRYMPAGICQHNFWKFQESGIIGTKTGNYYTSKKVCKAAHFTTTL